MPVRKIKMTGVPKGVFSGADHFPLFKILCDTKACSLQTFFVVKHQVSRYTVKEKLWVCL